MQKLIVFLMSVSFVTVSAQQPKYDFKKYLENNKPSVFQKKDPNSQKPYKSFIEQLNSRIAIVAQGKYLHSLSNGNKIYALPQDNMLCIVPDMRHFNMPNAGKGIRPSGMPPGIFKPYKIIPDIDSR